MPGSVTSVFTEPDDYEAALRADGSLGLLVTGRGRFRARLTQVKLDRLRLTAAEEDLPRIGFLAVPAETVMIPLSLDGRSTPIWGGIAMRRGDLISFGPGQRLHVRTEGFARWGALYVPAHDLISYGRALIGARFTIPAGTQCWRPQPASIKHLRRLLVAAIHTVRTRPETLLAKEAAHGLEQDLIHAVVSCLAEPASNAQTASQTRRHETAIQFESLLEAKLTEKLSLAEIAKALGVSARFLDQCCQLHIAMSPARYIRLRRMQLAYRGLRTGNHEGRGVSEVARRLGFSHLGHFADTYRGLFGKLPSATLRGLDTASAHATRHRTDMDKTG